MFGSPSQAYLRNVGVAFVCCLGILLSEANCMASRLHPVDEVRITSGRGWRQDPFGSGKLLFHNGWDYAVPSGTAVYPTEKGRVYLAGWHKGYGWLVVLDHQNGYYTMYGHNSKLLVAPGQYVDSATPIALAGSTGHSTGPHVHYEVRFWPEKYPMQRTPQPETPPSDGWITDWVDSGGMGGE